MRTLLIISIQFLAFLCYGQRAGLYLFNLQTSEGHVTVSRGTLLSSAALSTDRPCFHPGEPLLYYNKYSHDRLDLVAYNYESRETRSFKGAAGKKLYPAVTPDQKFISSLLEQPDGTRALVKLPIGGGPAKVLLPATSIANYVWVDDNAIIVWIPGAPSLLKLQTLRPKKELTVAQHTSDHLQKFFNTPSVTFVHKMAIGDWNIKAIQADGSIHTITQTLPQQDVFTWTPGRLLIMPKEGKLFFYDTTKESGWKEVETDPTFTFKNITQLAVNPAGDKIVIIGNP